MYEIILCQYLKLKILLNALHYIIRLQLHFEFIFIGNNDSSGIKLNIEI